ncbi:DUF975 family protein [Vagococcus martis]
MLLVIGITIFIGLMATDNFDATDSDYGSAKEEIMWAEEYDDDSFSSNVSEVFASVTSIPFASPIMSFVMTFLTIGISFTFLDVIRKGREAELSFRQSFRLFNGNDFVPVLLINILTYIFRYLWSLLFIIPGIVKIYSYSQANFIYKDLAATRDTRSMGATSFITESRDLMNGHKERLFWLDVSFLGWYLLGLLTLGIGFLWINPYVNATKAAFYDDLSKGKFLEAVVEEDDEIWTNF